MIKTFKLFECIDGHQLIFNQKLTLKLPPKIIIKEYNNKYEFLGTWGLISDLIFKALNFK
jgi:hypothetical protein